MQSLRFVKKRLVEPCLFSLLFLQFVIPFSGFYICLENVETYNISENFYQKTTYPQDTII